VSGFSRTSEEVHEEEHLSFTSRSTLAPRIRWAAFKASTSRPDSSRRTSLVSSIGSGASSGGR